MHDYSVSYGTSTSGYPVICIYNPSSPIVEMQLLVKSGSACDGGKHGVAHFMEHMLFQGSSHQDRRSKTREMNSIGAFNAYVTQFSTIMHFDCPNGYFLQGLSLIKESIFESVCPEEDVTKEKNVILEEIESAYSIPQTAFYDFAYEDVCGDVVGHQILGSVDSVQAINREDLIDFKNKHYTTQNMVVVVSGGINHMMALNAVSEVFPFVGLNDQTNKPELMINLNLGTKLFKSNSDQYEIMTFNRWVNESNNLLQKIESLVFLNALSMAFFERLRDDLGLCYSFANDIVSHNNESLLAFNFPTSSQSASKLIDEYHSVIDDIKEDGFVCDILTNAKKKTNYDYLSASMMPQSVASSIVDRLVAVDDLVEASSYVSGFLSGNIVSKYIDRTDNTKMIEMANRYLCGNTAFIMER